MIRTVDFEHIKATVIPYFVEVYGEEYRQIITDRLNRIVPLFIETPDGLKSQMFFEQSIKKTELTLRFLEEQGFTLTDEEKKSAIEEHSTYSLCANNEEIDTFLKGCFKHTGFQDFVYHGIDDIIAGSTDRDYENEGMCETLHCFGVEVSKEDYPRWRTSIEAEPVLRRLASLKMSIDELKKEYEDFNSKFKSIEEFCDKVSEMRTILEEQNFIEFLHSITRYMTEDEREALKNFKPGHITSFYSLQESCPIVSLVGITMASQNLFEAFSTETERQLANPNVSDFTKSNIIENRIEYFRKKGLYDGTAPESFLQSRTALVNWPSIEMADDITKKRRQATRKSSDELMRKTSSYEENVKTLEEANLVDKPTLSLKRYKEQGTCIIPAAKMIDGKLTEVGVLCYYLGGLLHEYQDVELIHELNHVVELSISKQDEDGKIYYKCGFETLISDPKESKEDADDEEKREYELFSETFNQLIAIEITKLMHDDGVYIFDDPSVAKVKGGVSYERHNKFVIEMWRKLKKLIIKGRVENSLEPLKSVLGADNFERMNGIIHEFNTMNYYTLMNSVIANENTPWTEKLHSLTNEALEITTKMVQNVELAKSNPPYDEWIAETSLTSSNFRV